MGVYVEKEWRYRKSKNANESTFAYKINQIRKGNTSSGRKGSREVFVKFTKGAKSRVSIRNAIKYISRDSKLELLDSDGLKQSSKEDIEDTIRFMQMNADLPQRYGIDLTKSLMFSPPKIAGVSKEDTLESVSKTLTSMYPDNYFVMAYHTDTKNPHVHVIINVNKSDGSRIRISGDKDYDEMKKRFANNLKDYGYDVKSTIKKEEIREEWKELTSKTNRNEYEVVKFGSGSYQLDKTKDRNNYLVYRTHNGKEVTVWGKEITSEIKNNDVRVGDKIKLKKIGTRDIKVPVYSKDGGEIVSWKNAKRNIWEIKNLSHDIEIKLKTDEHKLTEIKLDGEIRQRMHMKSREEFDHEKNMLLNPEYKQKSEEEHKLNKNIRLNFKGYSICHNLD